MGTELGCQRFRRTCSTHWRDERDQRSRKGHDARLQRQIGVQEPRHDDADPRPAEGTQHPADAPASCTKASLFTSR